MGRVAEYLEVQSAICRLRAACAVGTVVGFQGLFRIRPTQGRLLEVVKCPSFGLVLIVAWSTIE